MFSKSRNTAVLMLCIMLFSIVQPVFAEYRTGSDIGDAVAYGAGGGTLAAIGAAAALTFFTGGAALPFIIGAGAVGAAGAGYYGYVEEDKTLEKDLAVAGTALVGGGLAGGAAVAVGAVSAAGAAASGAATTAGTAATTTAAAGGAATAGGATAGGAATAGGLTAGKIGAGIAGAAGAAGASSQTMNKPKTPQDIYRANTNPNPVNSDGRKVYINSGVNWNQTDSAGRTNLERAKMGKSPLAPSGKPYEYHHDGQQKNGDLYMLEQDQHRGKDTYSILHSNRESEVNHGSEWNKVKKNANKAVGNSIEAQNQSKPWWKFW